MGCRMVPHLWVLGIPSSVGCYTRVQSPGSHFSIGKREHKGNRYAEMSGIL